MPTAILIKRQRMRRSAATLRPMLSAIASPSATDLALERSYPDQDRLRCWRQAEPCGPSSLRSSACPLAASSAACASACSHRATAVVMNPTPGSGDTGRPVLSTSSGGMRASAEPALCESQVGLVAFSSSTRASRHADRSRHPGKKALVCAFVACLRVLLEVAHGVGNALWTRASSALARARIPHIDVEAGVAQKQHQRDDRRQTATRRERGARGSKRLRR